MPARCSQLDWHDRPRKCSLSSARTLAATVGAPILRKGEITYLFACFSVRGWGCVMARHAAASAPTTPWSLVRSRNHLPGDDLPTGPAGAKIVTRVCCLGIVVCLAQHECLRFHCLQLNVQLCVFDMCRPAVHTLCAQRNGRLLRRRLWPPRGEAFGLPCDKLAGAGAWVSQALAPRPRPWPWPCRSVAPSLCLGS